MRGPARALVDALGPADHAAAGELGRRGSPGHPARRRRADPALRRPRGRRAGQPLARGLRRARRRAGGAHGTTAKPLLKLALLGRDRPCWRSTAATRSCARGWPRSSSCCARTRTGMSAEALCADLHGDGGSVSAAYGSRSRACASCSGRGSTPSATASPATSRPTCDASRACSRPVPCARPPRRTRARCCRDRRRRAWSDERDHLDGWLRQAVMTADDPEALWAWVHCSSGEDDLGAWKRLLSQLAFRDPRRSLCACAGSASCVQRRCNGPVVPLWLDGGDRRDASGSEAPGLSTARAALQVDLAARARARGRPRRPGRRGARQERLHRLQPARQPVRGGRRRPAPGRRLPLAPDFRRQVAAAPELHDLSALVDDLLARTHKRAYLAVLRGGAPPRRRRARPAGDAEAARPGPGDPRQRPRRSRSARSCSRSLRPRPSSATSRAGLRRFTPSTITDPDALAGELRRSGATGVAVDREEFDEDFCCLAAPVLDARRRFVAPWASR